MTLQEKIATLTKEQREKLAETRNEQELLAIIGETGIEFTDEDKATIARIAKMSAPKEGSKELSDEEVSKATGGGLLDWCCDKGVSGQGFVDWSVVFISKCEGCPLYFQTNKTRRSDGIYEVKYYCDFLGWTRVSYTPY